MDDFIGKTLEEGATFAQEKNLLFRVAEVDGKLLPSIMNIMANRVNVTVVEGVIVQARIG